MTKSISNQRQAFSLFIAAVFTVVTLFAFAQPVHAQEYSSNDQTIVEDCLELEEKLQEIVGTFEDRRLDHQSKYEQLSFTYGQIINRLDDASYEISILRELHPGLERRIVHFDEEAEMFMNELRDVMDSACRDKDSFYQELEEARESLKDVQLAVSDINDYVQTVLLVSVKNIISAGAEQ